MVRTREALGPPAAVLFSPAGSPWSVEDILTEDDEQDRVPLQKLKLLGTAEGAEARWLCGWR